MSDASIPSERPSTQWRLFGAIFAVLVLALIGWYYLVLRDDKTVLYHDLRPADATALASDLQQHGVHATLSANGRDISTPNSEADAARQVTASDPIATGVQGFELFDQAEMGLNEFDEKIRYQRALQGELERTLMSMDGVTAARVHISVPDRSPFRSEQMPAAAAVTLVLRSPTEETPGRVEGVQRLVAASVTGLVAANVVVLNGRGEILSPRVTVSSATPLAPDSEEALSARASDAIRVALPDRRFEIAISQDATAEAAPSAHPSVSRVITLSTNVVLTPAERDRVSAQLRQAGLVDASGAQKIVYAVADDTPLAASTAPAPQPDHHIGAAPSIVWIGWLALGIAALLLGSGSFLLWRRQKRTLNDEQQEDFAARLREALHGAGGDNG